MSDAINSFMDAVRNQRCATSETPFSGTQSREGTDEANFASPPPQCPRAPTVEVPADHSHAVTSDFISASAGAPAVCEVPTANQKTREDPAAAETKAAIHGPLISSDSDEDLDTTRSEFVATRMFFNQTQLVDDVSPNAKAPARGFESGSEEPETRPPCSQNEPMSADAEKDNFSPLARLPTSLAAEVKGNHTPSKSLPTPDVTFSAMSGDEDDDARSDEADDHGDVGATRNGGMSTADASSASPTFDRSTCRPLRDDSEFFFVDNHDGTGYLTNATRQEDGSYLLGQTVLMAQSQVQGSLNPPAARGRDAAGAASPVALPPPMNASPLPHQRRLREDAAGEAAAEVDLGATQNLMLNQSFAEGYTGAASAGAFDASFSMASFPSPSISRIITRAKNDRACGATPQRAPAPPRRFAAPSRCAAAKHLAFDSSLALDSSFVLMDQTVLGKSLCTNLGGDGDLSRHSSGFPSPTFGSPLPRRQRLPAAPCGTPLNTSFAAGGAASPVPDAPSEEPYLVREARAAREPGVDRIYVAPPTSEMTADVLTQQGWVPVFVDFRRKSTDFEITPTSQSPIPKDPRRARPAEEADGHRDAPLADAMYDDDDETNTREASLSRINALNDSLASSTALDQTVLQNINRRLSMSMSSFFPSSTVGSPLATLGAVRAGTGAVTSSLPPITPLAQIMRRQGSSSIWGAQSPVPMPPEASTTPFKREGSPSRPSVAASISIGQRTHITDLLTSLSAHQRPTAGSSDWYENSYNTGLLTNTEGSLTSTTTVNQALSCSAQVSSMAMPAHIAACRRTSNATATTSTTGTNSQAASMGVGRRSAQSVCLSSSFRVTHCKRASMGPTAVKGAMPLSRGQLSASTLATMPATVHHHLPSHRDAQPPQPTPQARTTNNGRPVSRGRPVNRGHQLDCATPVRHTTHEKPDTSAFVPWSPLTITPESSVNLGAETMSAVMSGTHSTTMPCPQSPASLPRGAKSAATVPGYSPDKSGVSLAGVEDTGMKWVPFTNSLATTTTTTEEDAGAASATDDGSSWGRPSLSLAASGISPAAMQALRDGILAAVQQRQTQPDLSSAQTLFDDHAQRSAAVAREDAAPSIDDGASEGVKESFATSQLFGATVMDAFSNMDSAATSAMMHSIVLLAANELQSQQPPPSHRPSQQSAQSDESEPEPRLSSAVVASIAQRWIAEQQRAGKENCGDDAKRGPSVASKHSSERASASPGRQPSLSARAPSELNVHRDSSVSA